MRPDHARLVRRQADFVLALLHPAAPLGALCSGQDPVRLARGIAIHRANVEAAVESALLARFPVVAELVGEAFFGALARAFLRGRPPRSASLSVYGARFPDFLRRFPPAAAIPYLPDIARLEWLRQRAVLADDAPHADAAALAAHRDGVLPTLRLSFHPATGLLVSPFPVVAIWNWHVQMPRAPALAPGLPPQTALVTRTVGGALRVGALSPAAGALTAALRRGATLGQAMRRADRGGDASDLMHVLATLFAAGAIGGIVPAGNPRRRS